MNKTVLLGWFHVPNALIQRKKYVFWALVTFLAVCYYNKRTRQTLLLKTDMTDMLSIQTDEIYPEIEGFRIRENQEFLINTSGCFIPNYAQSFSYTYKRSSVIRRCGNRAVFVDTLDDNNIKIRINETVLRKYYPLYYCCYKFVKKSVDPEKETDLLTYTPCKVFSKDAIVELDHEIIIVKCHENKTNTKRIRRIIYEDIYIKIKKVKKYHKQLKTTHNNTLWNILMIGIQGMSRTKVFDTMPLTAKYIRNHNWLDYKGYQKTGDQDGFSNLMSLMTGMNMSTIDWKCKSGLIKCSDFFIWHKYKDAGYYTAYGEDYLQMPDAFSKYKGFKGRPTDHYMRSFYLTGEKRLQRAKIVCMRNKPSATHLLEYAHNFVDSYKNNNTFGFFWIKSYTNSILNNPSLLDAEIVKFFEKLNNSQVLNNTFVIFFSDQGTSYGKMRIPMESYYDERLPMLFVWTPLEFRRLYMDAYHNLKFNEDHLITTYDLYATLGDVLRKTTNISDVIQSDACPQCSSLFEKKSSNRTCADAGVSDIWCSCHKMTDTGTENAVFDKHLNLVTAYIKAKLKYVKTVPCMTCRALRLYSAWRSHKYYNGNKTYYVMAFTMTPGHLIFETVVANYKVLHISPISGYNNRGNCALNPDYRPYCVCSLNRTCYGQKNKKKIVERFV